MTTHVGESVSGANKKGKDDLLGPPPSQRIRGFIGNQVWYTCDRLFPSSHILGLNPVGGPHNLYTSASLWLLRVLYPTSIPDLWK